MWENHIFNKCMINYQHFYGTATSLLLAVWSTHFCLNFNWQKGYQCYVPVFSFKIEVFFYRHNIYSLAFLSGFFFTGNIFPGYFQDIVWFCKIPGHFQDLENEFVIFQDAWEPRYSGAAPKQDKDSTYETLFSHQHILLMTKSWNPFHEGKRFNPKLSSMLMRSAALY